jgi:hypothetical protein
MVRIGQIGHQYAMMVTMDTDATGHGTRDTGHDPRPVLRASNPDIRIAGVPLPAGLPDEGRRHGTRDVPQDSVPQDTPTRSLISRDTPRDTVPQDTSRDTPARDTPRDTERDTERDGRPALLSRAIDAYRTSRASRAQTTGQRKILEDASRAARDAEVDRQRDAMSRAAASRRTAARGRTAETQDIAPIPRWMQVAGVWIDRTFGAIPLLAPLIVSGWFTMHVFTGQPLSTPWAIALCITGALEGGVWKLSRIYEKTLLEGDSTGGIRVAIGMYLLLISGMIYGHAYYLAWTDAKASGDVDATKLVLDWSKYAPAAGVALMSFLGVMVWSKSARYQHRVKLRANGQVDPRAPKFATMAWILTPRETAGALRHSVKYRISSPETAVEDRRLYRAAGRPPIWPIPAGFAWTNGTLVQTDPLEGRDVRDAVPLGTDDRPAIGTGHGTGQHGTRDIGHGTPARVINGTSRESVPQLLAGRPVSEHGTRDTGHGTRDADGTRNAHGTPHFADGTADPSRDGTRDIGGTRDTDGTPTGHGTPGDTDDFADVLKYGEHLLAVTEAFPGWMEGAPPAVRKITAAIDEYRRKKDGGSYNSNGTSNKVQEFLVRLRERPELLDLMRVEQEGPEA